MYCVNYWSNVAFYLRRYIQKDNWMEAYEWPILINLVIYIIWGRSSEIAKDGESFISDTVGIGGRHRKPKRKAHHHPQDQMRIHPDHHVLFQVWGHLRLQASVRRSMSDAQTMATYQLEQSCRVLSSNEWVSIDLFLGQIVHTMIRSLKNNEYHHLE